VRAMLLALPLPSSLPVRLPSTSFFGPPCSAIAVASSAALVPALFCPRIISRYLSLDDGDDHDDDDHAVSSRKIGGGVDAAAAVWRSSRTKSRRRSLSIPRSRRNPEGFVVELRFRRRSFHSSSLLSMAAACNSPPPDYRANVGVCLVNSKNEVTLLLDLVVFSGGKQDRKKERKKGQDFHCNCERMFGSVAPFRLCVCIPNFGLEYLCRLVSRHSSLTSHYKPLTMELFQGVLLWCHGLSMSLQTSDDGVVP